MQSNARKGGNAAEGGYKPAVKFLAPREKGRKKRYEKNHRK